MFINKIKKFFEPSQKDFCDGSRIKWLDQEHIVYSEPEKHIVIAAYLYGDNILSEGTRVELSDVEYWRTLPGEENKSMPVTTAQKERLEEKIKAYYEKYNKKCIIK